MGYDLFKCEICGGQVSRRKSFSLKELNGREGRACRHHPEVIKLLRERFDEKKLRREVEELSSKFTVLALVAKIRVLYTMFGVPPEVVFCRMRCLGGKSSLIQAVKDELAKVGGPKMSMDEVFSSILAWSTVSRYRV